MVHRPRPRGLSQSAWLLRSPARRTEAPCVGAAYEQPSGQPGILKRPFRAWLASDSQALASQLIRMGSLVLS